MGFREAGHRVHAVGDLSISNNKEWSLAVMQNPPGFWTSFGGQVTERLEERFSSLDRMASRHRGNFEEMRVEWQKDAINYYQGYSGFQALEWNSPKKLDTPYLAAV